MFENMSGRDDDNYPTAEELDRREAFELSANNPAVAWVCTDRDAWHANPFYTGPAVPHPELIEDDAEMGAINIDTLIQMLQVQKAKGAKIVKLDGKATLLTDNGNFVLFASEGQW